MCVRTQTRITEGNAVPMGFEHEIVFFLNTNRTNNTNLRFALLLIVNI